MVWRSLQFDEEFWYDDGPPSLGRSSSWSCQSGYAVQLQKKGHRHCGCLLSKRITFVEEHHQASGSFPMHYLASEYSAARFLSSRPDLVSHGLFTEGSQLGVSYGFILRKQAPKTRGS